MLGTSARTNRNHNSTSWLQLMYQLWIIKPHLSQYNNFGSPALEKQLNCTFTYSFRNHRNGGTNMNCVVRCLSWVAQSSVSNWKKNDPMVMTMLLKSQIYNSATFYSLKKSNCPDSNNSGLSLLTFSMDWLTRSGMCSTPMALPEGPT